MIDRLFRLKEIFSAVQFCRKYRSAAKKRLCIRVSADKNTDRI